MSRLAGRAALVAVAWLVLALLFTPQTYLINQRGPVPFSWFQAFSANAALFGLWALLTPAVLWLARTFPIERGVLVRHLALHVVAAFVTAFVHILVLGQLDEVLMRLLRIGDAYRPPVPIQAMLVGYGATNVMIYWGVVAIGQALAYFQRYQDRELRITQAELHALRTQLQPHFLFNALNAIAELVHVDAARADAAITRLSDLLRLALGRGQADEVPLEEELDFVRTYVEIQQMLLQERLDVRWQIDEETLDACVPAMVLQPLVENAVQHGLAPRVGGGTLEISARRQAHRLRLEVVDNGVGMSGAVATGAGGIGLSNTRARLRHLYGSAAALDIAAREGGGVNAVIDIPYRTSPRGQKLEDHP
jgi:two-component system LytT family sensor kinase